MSEFDYKKELEKSFTKMRAICMTQRLFPDVVAAIDLYFEQETQQRNE